MRSNSATPFSIHEIGSDLMCPTQPAELAVEVGDLVSRLISLLVSPTEVKASRLLNAQEVADLLNTNSQVVYRLARSQELPAVNLGERILRFSELSVSEFIKRGGVSRAA